MESRIMVVDDDPDIVDLVSDILAPRGHEMVRAQTGEEALEKLEKEKIDLIIMDIMMPVMDGINACERIKRNPETSHIPIVMLTVKQDLESKIEAIGVEVDEYLTKPFDADILVELVKRYLGQ